MTLTVHAAPVVLTMTGPPLRDGAVLVEHDRVVEIGPRAQVDARGARVREWPGVMTPGLVNAHAHLELGPPFADLATAGLPFAQWLAQLDGRGQGMTDADWQVSARGSAHQLLRSGTTAVADVVTRGPAVAVAASLGLQWSSYAELARTGALRLHRDPVATADEPDRRPVVVLCTRSDAVLQAGEAPVAGYLAEGGPVAIGTDSLASSPDLDLLAEARATRDLAVRQGLDAPEEAVVRALTLGGAQALGLPLGTLVPGGRADLAVFDVPTGEPFRDLVEHGAGRCVATVLGGRLVHRR